MEEQALETAQYIPSQSDSELMSSQVIMTVGIDVLISL